MKKFNLYIMGAAFALFLVLGCKKESSEPGNLSADVQESGILSAHDLEITLEGSFNPKNTFYFKIGTVVNGDTAFTYHVVPAGYVFKADVAEDNDAATGFPFQLNKSYIIYVVPFVYSGGCGIDWDINEYLSIKYTDIQHGKAVLKYDICSGGKFVPVSKGDYIETEIGHQSTWEDPMLKDLL